MGRRFATPRSLISLALGIFAAALVALLSVGGQGRVITQAQRSQAIMAAEHGTSIHDRISSGGPVTTAVTDLDGSLVRVTFRRGLSVLAEAAVTPAGSVTSTKVPQSGPRYGSALSDSPLVLSLMGLVFLLATLRLPLRRIQNLDAIACLGFIGCILAEDHLVQPVGTLLGTTLLAYLGVRCAIRGLTTRIRERSSQLLLGMLTTGWTAPRKSRMLGFGTAAVTFCVILVGLSAASVIDVGFASTAGATLLNHGTSPYGHLPPEIIHGDTYPLLNYAIYMPGAALAPVWDGWGDTRSATYVAVIAALVAAGGLALASRRRLGSGWPESLRMAAIMLAFPTTAITIASGSNDLLLAAGIAVLLALAPFAGRSSLTLTLAIWIKLAPIALVPLWLARLRGAALLRAIAAIVAVSAGATTWLLVIDGTHGVRAMLDGIGFQFTRGSLQSAWSILGVESGQRVLQAAVVAFIAVAALRLRRDPDLGRDTQRLAALVGAVLIGLQLGANNWSYLYLVWIVPCLALSLFHERPVAEPAAARW